jgi:hypothetical protein
MARAATTARAVKDSPARAVLELAEKYLGSKIATKGGPDACQAPAEASTGACCPPVDTAPVSLGKPGSSKKCC